MDNGDRSPQRSRVGAAETALKVEFAGRMRTGGADDSLNADSPFSELADAWLEDLLLDVDRAASTKEIYERGVSPPPRPAAVSSCVASSTCCAVCRREPGRRPRRGPGGPELDAIALAGTVPL
jgi:hypothetical protein